MGEALLPRGLRRLALWAKVEAVGPSRSVEGRAFWNGRHCAGRLRAEPARSVPCLVLKLSVVLLVVRDSEKFFFFCRKKGLASLGRERRYSREDGATRRG